ncbi:MAG: DUF2155 domain-containing protein [Labrys sp. (in: a-proteobacteria)]
MTPTRLITGLMLAGIASGPAFAERIENPTAVFSGLDKITGQIISFDVAINETVQFGALQVTPRVCYSRPPSETPQTTTFIEVDEITLSNEKKRVFSGWMFASSPGLHAIDHPVYDVWLTDCKGGKLPDVPAVAATPEAPAGEPAAPAAPDAGTDLFAVPEDPALPVD